MLLVTPYDETDGLWDVVAHPNDLDARLANQSTVWALELREGDDEPLDVTALRELGYEIDGTALIHRTTVYRMVLP